MKKLVVSTTEYVVQDRDTIERIAAKFDCTPSQLTKLNKLASRILFTGQTIFVPDGTYVEEVEEIPTPQNEQPVPTPDENIHTSNEPVAAAEDVECMQRFFKVHTERLLPNGKKTSGVLIVTPSCAMFDPDPYPYESLEQVHEKFGMVASVDEVLCVALYEEINAGGRDMDNTDKSVAKDPPLLNVEASSNRNSTGTEPAAGDCSDLSDQETSTGNAPRSSTFDSSSISSKVGLAVAETVLKEGVESHFEPSERRSSFAALRERKSDPSRTLSPQVIRRKFSSGLQKLRDSWRSSDGSDKEVGLSSLLKRKSSAGVRKSVGDSTKSLELESTNLSAATSYEDLSGTPTLQRQKEYFDAFDTLMLRTIDLRSNLPRFYEAMQRVEALSLKSVSSDSRTLPQTFCLRVCTNEKRRSGSNVSEPVGDPNSLSNETKEPQKLRKEFWYYIPQEKTDVLYLLFIQWCAREEIKPIDTMAQDIRFLVLDESKYADRLESSSNSEEKDQPTSLPVKLENLRFNWELVALDEYKRRFSLTDLTDSFFLPLPEGASESQLLDETSIRRLIGVLPARAQSYPWVLIYSSHSHGFSLRTLYHKMGRWTEEASPSLLIIKDSNNRVFGAVISCALRVAEHFYGSGESLLFTNFPKFRVYTWTGANNFVVKGSVDSLAIGAGRGTFGLYLDADFYHGRTQRCETFGNEPLTDNEDFTIVGVEVFGFSINL